MSILNVNQIQPVGGGNTITVSASDVSASGATITASSFVGNVTGNVTSSSTSTFSSGLNVTGGSVGIGTDNAATPLHLFGTSDILLKVESTDQYAHIELGDNSSTARITNDGATGTLRLRADKDNAVSSSNIQFEIDGSEKVRITSSGNVGIGSDNPQTKLDVAGDVKILDNSPRLFFYDANATGASNATGGFEVFDKDGNRNVFCLADAPNADNLIFGVTGSERLRITSDGYARLTTSNARLEWTASSGSNPFIRSIGSGQQELEFNTGGNEAARFTSSGNLKFPSGQGIDFSAASGSASGSTSAVLDDYEEGTFTPRISVEAQGSDAAIDNVSGTYVRVGQLVHCTFNADLNGIPAGRGTSTAWQWGGLPFTSLAEGSEGSEDYIGSVRIAGADHTSTYGVAGDFILRLFDNGTGGRIEAMRVSNGDIVNASLYMKDNTSCNGSITYRTL